jgi:hypothetical protein
LTYPIANSNYGVANGSNSTSVFITQLQSRDPTVNDVNYPITKRWVNVVTGKEFILVNFTSMNGSTLANWINLTNGTAGNIDSLSGESGTNPVFGDTSSNINVYGDSTSINITGDSATHTLTASVILPDQYTVLASNDTSIAGIAPSTAGFVLTSNGAAMPTFQAPSGSSLAMSPFGSTPNANAGTIATGTLTLQPADGTHPGAISLGTQTLGSGTKTFTSAPIMPLTGMVLGNGASALSAIPLTNGQLVIGSSSGPPIAASLTAGTGISITPAANSITISSTAPSGINWSQKFNNFTAEANNGYVITTSITASLPSGNFGDIISFLSYVNLPVIIEAPSGGVIYIGKNSCSASGTASTTSLGDSITLLSLSSNIWINIGAPQGTWILS